MDKSLCVAVLPGGECPNCGWSVARPFIKGMLDKDGNQSEIPEPHPTMPHGSPNVIVIGHCANCGAMYNLDAVKCATCGFEPADDVMYDKLMAEKNVYRKKQGIGPLPVRCAPIVSTADVKPMPTPPPVAPVSVPMTPEELASVNKMRDAMKQPPLDAFGNVVA